MIKGEHDSLLKVRSKGKRKDLNDTYKRRAATEYLLRSSMESVLFALTEETPSSSQRGQIAAVCGKSTVPRGVRARVWKTMLAPWWGGASTAALLGIEAPKRSDSGTLEESEEILGGLCESVCLRFRVIGAAHGFVSDDEDFPLHREVKTMIREYARKHEMDVYSIAGDSASGICEVFSVLCFPSLCISPLEMLEYADALCHCGMVSFLNSNKRLLEARMDLLASLLKEHCEELLSHLLAIGAQTLKGRRRVATDASALLASIPFRFTQIAFAGTLPASSMLHFWDMLIFDLCQSPDPRGSLTVYLILEALLRAFSAYEASDRQHPLPNAFRSVMAKLGSKGDVAAFFDAARELRATSPLSEAAAAEISLLRSSSDGAMDVRNAVDLRDGPVATEADLFDIGASDSEDDDDENENEVVGTEKQDEGDPQWVHIFKGIVPGASVPALQKLLQKLGEDRYVGMCFASSPAIPSKRQHATLALAASRIALFAADPDGGDGASCIFNAHASMIERATTQKMSPRLIRLYFNEGFGVEPPKSDIAEAGKTKANAKKHGRFLQLEFSAAEHAAAFVRAVRRVVATFQMP